MTMQFITSTGVMTGSTGQVFFDNIPQTFAHLQIRTFGRINVAATNSATSGFQINTIGSNVYDGHFVLGNGSTASSGRQGFFNAWFTQPFLTANNSGSNVFGVQIIDILDYANTSKNKTIRAIGGFDDNNASGGANVGLYSGLWMSTAAVTSLTINVNGNLFVAGSRIDLYGITTSAVTGA